MSVLAEETARAASRNNIPFTINRVGSLMTLFFTGNEVTNYEQAKLSDTGQFARFFQRMLNGGVYLAPSQFEAAFVSYAHTDDDLEFTSAAVRDALSNV